MIFQQRADKLNADFHDRSTTGNIIEPSHVRREAHRRPHFNCINLKLRTVDDLWDGVKDQRRDASRSNCVSREIVQVLAMHRKGLLLRQFRRLVFSSVFRIRFEVVVIARLKYEYLSVHKIRNFSLSIYLGLPFFTFFEYRPARVSSLKQHFCSLYVREHYGNNSGRR